jgi:hypothetical protein
MFPFSQDFRDYTKVTEAEVQRSLADIYPRGVVYQLGRTELPDSLQKIPTLAASFVSGVAAPIIQVPNSGEARQVIFTVRLDMTDAPETGNLNAYLLLRVDNETYMSPPCSRLREFPHHFSGQCPISAAFKP